MDPIAKGDYPPRMRQTVGDRLPTFSKDETALVMGSIDFVALNYYFPYVTSPGSAQASDQPSFYKDMNITSGFDPSWPLSQTGWGIYGPGLTDLLIYTQQKYSIHILHFSIAGNFTLLRT